MQLHTQFLSLFFLRPFCNLNGTIFFGGLSNLSAAIDKKLGFLQAGREQGRVLLSLTATVYRAYHQLETPHLLATIGGAPTEECPTWLPCCMISVILTPYFLHSRVIYSQ